MAIKPENQSQQKLIWHLLTKQENVVCNTAKCASPISEKSSRAPPPSDCILVRRRGIWQHLAGRQIWTF